MYGPLVLAAELGKSGMPSIYTNNNFYIPPPDDLLSKDSMLNWIGDRQNGLDGRNRKTFALYSYRQAQGIYAQTLI